MNSSPSGPAAEPPQHRLRGRDRRPARSRAHAVRRSKRGGGRVCARLAPRQARPAHTDCGAGTCSACDPSTGAPSLQGFTSAVGTRSQALSQATAADLERRRRREGGSGTTEGWWGGVGGGRAGVEGVVEVDAQLGAERLGHLLPVHRRLRPRRRVTPQRPVERPPCTQGRLRRPASRGRPAT